MNRETPSAFLLFELLARRWTTPAAVEAVSFNAAQSHVAAPLANGSIALVACADREAPEDRIATDDAGRKTIAPRKLNLPPATVAAARGPGPAKMRPDGGDGFLVGYRDGSLWRLSVDGSMAALGPKTRAPVIALDRSAHAGRTLVVGAEETMLLADGGGVVRAPAPAGVRSADLSPDGTTIAFGLDAALILAPADTPGSTAARFPTPGAVNAIKWRPDGAFVAGVCEDDKALALVDVGASQRGVLTGFAAAPRSIAWSASARALVVSGAYRIAAWSLHRPPFGGDHSGALETGRAGMVAVDQVAAHPSRSFVAAAHANGQVVIAEIGRRDELQLKASGPRVNALAWSDDGRMLAIAAQDALSLVSLPDVLFK